MSTVITLPNSPAKLPEHGEPKFTAPQIEKDCPARLQHIGREITERLKKAEKQAKLATDQMVAVEQLLAEAKRLCDDAGFKKFHELFCPQLRKSQAYALRAIAAGKKTLVEHRTGERERKQKSRANQRAAAANSGTVPDKPTPRMLPQRPARLSTSSTAIEQTPWPSKCPSTVPSAEAANSGAGKEKSKRQDAPTEAGVVERPDTAVDQTSEPSRPWSARATDELMSVFTVHTTELQKRIDKRPPEHFSATVVPVEFLEQLGSFFTKLANIKKSEAVRPAPTMALPDNGQPAGAHRSGGVT